MIAPNIFKPRNDWNIVTLKARKHIALDFKNKLARIIQDKTSFNPFSDVKYRGGNVVKSRQLFIVMMVRYTKESYETIGAYFGKDHSTVSHSIKTVQNLCDTDRKYRELYDSINMVVKNLT
jgi:hypothetical protein